MVSKHVITTKWRWRLKWIKKSSSMLKFVVTISATILRHLPSEWSSVVVLTRGEKLSSIWCIWCWRFSWKQHVGRTCTNENLKSLIIYYLEASSDNKLVAEVSGRRKREVGLVVPAYFTALTKRKENATFLFKKLKEKKEKSEGHIKTLSILL